MERLSFSSICIFLFVHVHTVVLGISDGNFMSPLDAFTMRNTLRRHNLAVNSGRPNLVNVFVAPYGSPDCRSWWENAALTSVGVRKINAQAFTVSVMLNVANKLSPRLSAATAGFTDLEFQLCLFDQNSVEKFCSQVRAQPHPFYINLGPEASGFFLVTAKPIVERELWDDVGWAEFEVGPGQPIEHSCAKAVYEAFPIYSKAPLPRVPESFCLNYTLGDAVPVRTWYFDDFTSQSKRILWHTNT